MEGRNREVRRMWEAVDLKVSRLMRVRYGSVMMTKNNRPGRFYELEPKEIRELADLAGVEYDKALRSGKPIKKPTGRRSEFALGSRKPNLKMGKAGGSSRNSSKKSSTGRKR